MPVSTSTRIPSVDPALTAAAECEPDEVFDHTGTRYRRRAPKSADLAARLNTTKRNRDPWANTDLMDGWR